MKACSILVLLDEPLGKKSIYTSRKHLLLQEKNKVAYACTTDRCKNKGNPVDRVIYCNHTSGYTVCTDSLFLSLSLSPFFLVPSSAHHEYQMSL